VAGKLAWAHSASAGNYALITAHEKRGTKAIDAAGVLPAFRALPAMTPGRCSIMAAPACAAAMRPAGVAV